MHGNFIIESRLPIMMNGTKEQIGLYVENRELFTDAVKEFTAFLCQSSVKDIIGNTGDPYNQLSETPIGRYDNMAFYLENNIGMIGLIDLEEFTPLCDKSEKNWCAYKCYTAVCMFPYHLDEIIQVAKEYDSNIEVYRASLEQHREGALKRFRIGYENHLALVKDKKITFENPLELIEVNCINKEKIKNAIILLLHKEHEDKFFNKCMGEHPAEVILLFEKSYTKIFDLIANFLSECLKRNLEKREGISTYIQLLSCRTLQFFNSSDYFKSIQWRVASELTMFNFKQNWHSQTLAYEIIPCVFKELADCGEISYYNPSFGRGEYAVQCIFC